MYAPAWDFEEIYRIIFNNLLDQTVKIVQQKKTKICKFPGVLVQG